MSTRPWFQRRWLRRVTLVLVVLLALRALLALTLVPCLGWVLSSRGLELNVYEHSLSVWQGELRLDGVVLRARDERGVARGAAILELDWALLDLSLARLCRGELVVERAEFDGLRVELERAADGTLSWARYFSSEAGSPPAPAPAPAPWSFDAPLEVQELRLSGARLHWIDRARENVLDARVELELSGSQLGSRTERSELKLQAHCPGLLESLRVQTQLRAQGLSLDGRLEWALERLNQRALQPELRSLGLDLRGDELALRGSLAVALQPIAGQSSALQGRCTLQSLEAERDGLPLLSVAESSLVWAELSPLRWALDSIQLGQVQAQIWLEHCEPFDLYIDELSVGHLDWSAPALSEATPIRLRVRAPGVVDEVSCTANARLSVAQGELDTQIELSGIDLEAIAPWLAARGMQSEWQAGRGQSRARLRWDAQGFDAQLEGLRLENGAAVATLPGLELLRWRSSAPGIWAADRLRIQDLDLDLRIDPAGHWHALGLKSLLPNPAWAGPGLDCSLKDVVLELSGLDSAPAAAPAQLDLHARLSPLMQSLRVQGTIDTQAALQAQLAIEGLDARSLAPYTQSLGWVPELSDAKLQAQLRWTPHATSSDLEISALSCTQAEREWLAWKRLAWTGIAADAAGSARLALEGLRLPIERDAQARLSVLGWRQTDPSVERAPSNQAAVAGQTRFPTVPAILPNELALDAQVLWRDAATQVECAVDLEGGIQGLAQIASQPCSWSLKLKLDEQQGQVELAGQSQLTSTQWDGEVRAKLQAVSTALLARYAPQAVEPNCERMSLELASKFQLRAHELGGQAFQLSWDRVALHADDQPVAALGAGQWELLRFDPSTGHCELGAAQLQGMELAIQRDELGRWGALGWRWREASSTAAPAQSWNVRVDTQLEPPDAQEPRYRAQVLAQVPGLVESFEARAQLLIEPQAWKLEHSCSLRGMEIPAGLGVDASMLQGGSLSWKLAAQWQPGKAPRLDLELSQLQLQSAQGELLAGLDALHVDGLLRDPASANTLIEELRITQPRLRLQRDDRGWTIAGLRFVPNAAPDPDAVASELPQPSAESPSPKAPEWAIARTTIEGCDFVLDEGDLRLALQELDLELGRISTTLWAEDRPLAFHGSVGGSSIAVPKVHRSGSLLHLVAQAGGKLLSGGDEALVTEERPWVDELSVRGRLRFFPDLQGWTQIEVASLELLALRSLALRQGIDIGDGSLDSSIRLRFLGTQGMTLASDNVFTNLSLSEPSGGPISSLLRLPAPLDTVLFLLKNEADEHRIPVRVKIGPEGMHPQELTSAVISAISGVITRAVASSPFRVLGSVTAMLGISSEPALAAQALSFPAGSVEWDPAGEKQFQNLVTRWKDDERRRFVLSSSLSAADIEFARVRANPSVPDALALSQRLRQRKQELMRSRTELLTRIKVDLATARTSEAESARQDLVRVDSELGSVELALDQMLERLEPGDERRNENRAKRFCLALSRERVANIRQRLLEVGVRPERIEVRPVKLELAPEGSGGAVQIEVRKRS